MEDAGEFGKADFILLLEKGVITGCSHNEDHKISNHILSTLLEYEYEVNAKQEVSVRRGLLAFDPKTVLPEKMKISNRKKTVTKHLQKNPENGNKISIGAACEKTWIA